MSIEAVCPACAKAYQVEDERRAGQRFRCPQCSVMVRVPHLPAPREPRPYRDVEWAAKYLEHVSIVISFVLGLAAAGLLIAAPLSGRDALTLFLSGIASAAGSTLTFLVSRLGLGLSRVALDVARALHALPKGS